MIEQLHDIFNYIRNYALLVNFLCEQKLRKYLMEVLLNQIVFGFYFVGISAILPAHEVYF